MWVVYSIIALTVAVSAWAFREPDVLYRFALIPERISRDRQWYRLLSHVLLHGGWMHLLINMLVFYSFASNLLIYFEHLRGAGFSSLPSYLHLLRLYVLGGLVAGAISFLAHRRGSGYMSVGASGAVSAVMACSIFFSPWTPLYIFGLVPLPGVLFMVLYVGYSYWMERRGGDGIDHWAHLGGGIFGLLYPILIDYHLFQYFIKALFTPPWL